MAGSPAAAQTGGLKASPERAASTANDGAVSTNKITKPEVTEIVVTAQKRSEKLQDVPISVVALPAKDLVSTGIKSSSDLASVSAGFVFFDSAGYSQPHMRGIGTVANGPGVENPIALYVDGVYHGTMASSSLTLPDIDQIEIDRGPQGTLFGRNATGGLIQIKTRDPSYSFKGGGSIGYGDHDTLDSNLYLTGGLTDNLAANFAISYKDQGRGFGTNSFTGQEVNKSENLALRSKLLFEPSAKTEITLAFDYSRSEFTPAWVPAPGTTPLGGPIYTGPTQGLDGYMDPFGLQSEAGVSLRVQQDLGWANLVSLSAYRYSRLHVSYDGSLVRDFNYVANIETIEPHNQISQEFQLTSPTDSSLKWAVGAYLYYANGKYDPISITGGLIAPLGATRTFSLQKTQSAALFGQATKKILPETNLTLGLRYTVEKRGISNRSLLLNNDGSLYAPEISDHQQKTFSKPSWRISIDHKINNNILMYASYNRGFKSGGFNDDLVPTTAYAPEILDAYEIGSKASLLSRRLHLNTAFFLYNYKNIQSVRYPAGLELIYNAGAARLYGLDFDVEIAVARRLSLKAGIEWLHSEYTRFPDAPYSVPVSGGGVAYTTRDATGNQVALAPKLTSNITANYELPTTNGKFNFTINYTYNSGWFAEPDNRLRQPSYGTMNASIAWTSRDEWTTIRAWGSNITNTAYLIGLVSQSNGDAAEYAPPRTYGITLERRF
jgi:iron complex outermembrane receptor protein